MPRRKCSITRVVPFDREALKASLEGIRRGGTFEYAAPDARGAAFGSPTFRAPATLAEFARLRAAHPNARLLAGSTDVGLWVTKQFRELGDILFIGNVDELKTIARDAQKLTIGAAASLEDAYAALAADYPELAELWTRFASLPIRNAGTLGGNVANGSPIGDSMPALIALDARSRAAERPTRPARCRSTRSISAIRRPRSMRANSSRRSACRGRRRACGFAPTRFRSATTRTSRRSARRSR